MSLSISYLSNSSKNISSNLVLFVNEKFSTNNFNTYVSKSELIYINDLLKNIDPKKNIFTFELNAKKKIILISIKKDLNRFKIENLGAEFYEKINKNKNDEYFINSDSIESRHKNFIGYFLHGLKLKSYKFNKYKSKKENRLISIKVLGKKNTVSNKDKVKFKALEEGTFFARDLVSEPGNILHPDEYAKRITALKKDGLKVTIYDKKK